MLSNVLLERFTVGSVLNRGVIRAEHAVRVGSGRVVVFVWRMGRMDVREERCLVLDSYVWRG